MKRNLKALGLAMVAAFALSAVAASGAQATDHLLKVASAPAIITAKDHVNTKFEITGGEHNVTCNTTLYEGTVGQTSNTEVTVTPTYSECKVDGFISATVEVNHCAYILTGNTDANGDAEVHIECAKKEGTEEHTEITIKYNVLGSSCVVHVHPTQTLRGAHYTSTTNPSSGKEDITVELTVEKIKYQETGNGFCPGTHTGEDGTLKGAVTAEAWNSSCEPAVGTARTTPSHSGCEVAVQNLTLE